MTSHGPGESPLRILVADDDAVGATMLARSLQRWSFDAVTAADGERAWERLQADPTIRVAIVDWMMPGVDGLELCRRIRADERTAHLHVIMLTARDARGDLIEALTAGADDYLIKPFDPDELRARVQVASRVATLQAHLAERVAELHASQAHLQFLSANMLDLVAHLRPDGTFAYASPSHRQMLGYPPDVLVGTSSLDLVHPDDRDRVVTAMRLGLTTLEPGRAEYRARRADGEYVWMEAVGAPLPAQGGGASDLLMSARDITDRKKDEERVKAARQELERSNAELGQFVYIASHDLQEPLRMVTSYLGLIARRYQGVLDEDAKEFIAFAVDGAARMQRLLNDLLVYSRVGTKAKPLAPVDAGAALQAARDNLRVAIDEAAATITTGSMPMVSADETQLIQLFQNLLANAIKFRGTPAPVIHVTAAREADDAWRFAVRDNGIGIDPADFERMFQMFQRLNPAGKYPGTGAGLAICKKIVTRHGGRIWAESAVGQGATFFFTLQPAAPIAAA
jgi:two-component system, chemotaxis family, sensor kinase Cph1